MAEIVQGLFGISPEQLNAQREQQLQEQALQYAQLSPLQRAASSMYQGGSRLGGAIAGMMGGEDPAMQRATELQQIGRQLDLTTPEGMIQGARMLASKGYNQEAMQLQQKAQAAQQAKAEEQLTISRTNVEQQKLAKGVLDAKQEASLRDELSNLGPNATQEDILGVVTKYGSPDKVLSALQASADRAATREGQAALQKERLDAQKQMAQERIDAQIEAAKLAGATRKEIEQMRIDGRREMAQIAAALKQSSQVNKPLPASLQKEEGADLASIDTYSSQQAALAPAIASLTPNSEGVRKLNLGPVQNMKYIAQNAAGNSTPESRAYEGLKSAVDTAVNLQVSAEKGVQTDKDVLRFAQALVAAYGRNDSQATLEALQRYNNALAVAAEKTQNRLESRRKSQNVEPYGFKATSTPTVVEPTAPASPAPTMRWNPTTKKLERI